MLSDMEIARAARLKPIQEIAAKLGLTEDDYECYGKYKAKINNINKDNPKAKLILVTAMNPHQIRRGQDHRKHRTGRRHIPFGQKKAVWR